MWKRGEKNNPLQQIKGLEGLLSKEKIKAAQSVKLD